MNPQLASLTGKSNYFGSIFLVRYLLFLILTMLYFCIIYINYTDSYSVFGLSVTGVSFVIFSIFFLGKSLLGFNGIFVTYLILTHLGIPVVNLLTDNIFLDFKDSQLAWYYSNSYSRAVAIANLGICSFLYFTCIVNTFNIKKTNNIKTNNLHLENKGPKEFYYMGISLIVIFTLYFLYNVLTGKIIYSGNYANYYSSLTNLESYSIMLFLFAVGITFSYATCDRKHLRITTILILIPAVLLIIKGNRGEILYPLAASIAVLFKRGIQLDLKKIVLVCILFFIIIPVIKDVRAYDLNEMSRSGIQVNWTDSFVEVGYTIRPLVYTVEWIDSGEELAFGRTYAIPIQRIIATAVPVIEKMNNRNDRYSFRDRLPTMGYSVIAEAFFNFGRIGVIFIMALLAFILNYLGDRAVSFPRLIFTGGFLAIMINNVRNAFSFVPGQTIILMTIVAICLILGKISMSKGGYSRIQVKSK